MPGPTPADRIKARSDADAKKRYRKFLNLSLSAISSTAQWIIVPLSSEPDQFHAVTRPSFVPIDTNLGPMFLRATQRFCYVDHPDHPNERKVQTRDYTYTLSTSETEGEVLSWQWHPALGPLWPHLHINRGHGGREHKWHIPTGRVAFEDVLVFLFHDFDVPLARNDGRDIVEESRRRFHAFRTWA